VEAGKIVKITPNVGTLVEKGSTINITLSEGMYYVVKDYKNLPFEEVKLDLKDTKITIRVEYLASQDVAQGVILDQSLLLPGTKLNPSRSYEIKFVVSAPVEFLIPQIVGLNVAQAQAQLEALGAVVYLNQLSTENMSEEELNNLVRDVVISITPEPLTYYTQGGNNFIVLSYY
jgi:serine/threonine-protein kinase